MTGHDVATVLDTDGTLDDALDQVADIGGGGADGSHQHYLPHRYPPGCDQTGRDTPDDAHGMPADESRDALVGADLQDSFVRAAEPHAEDEGEDVVGEDKGKIEDQQDHAVLELADHHQEGEEVVGIDQQE